MYILLQTDKIKDTIMLMHNLKPIIRDYYFYDNHTEDTHHPGICRIIENHTIHIVIRPTNLQKALKSVGIKIESDNFEFLARSKKRSTYIVIKSRDSEAEIELKSSSAITIRSGHKFKILYNKEKDPKGIYKRGRRL